MKVGILTYHNSHNYGAVLQAYGLQQFLVSNGMEVEFIHYLSEEKELRNRYKRPIRGLKDLIAAVAYRVFAKQLGQRYEKFEAFLRDYLKTSNRFKTYQELEQANFDYDAVVAGSDQIWNFTDGASPVYYGRFLPESVPLIAYAPSFGKFVAKDSSPSGLQTWLNRFASLSARESNGVDFIRELTGREVTHVLDPAFFLTASEWSAIAEAPAKEEKYLLFYALELNGKTVDLVKRLQARLGIKIVIAGKGDRLFFDKNSSLAIDSGPREFLGLIRGASLVVSNSFHATVFSILFEVPFLTLGHSTRNERIKDLLEMVGEEERLILPNALDEEPDGALIERGASAGSGKRLDDAIQLSKSYLTKSLRCPSKTSNNNDSFLMK